MLRHVPPADLKKLAGAVPLLVAVTGQVSAGRVRLSLDATPDAALYLSRQPACCAWKHE